MAKTDQALIKQFFDLEAQIWALVGEDTARYSGVEDCTDSSFALDENEVVYGQPGSDDYYDGTIYGTAIFRGPSYTIAVINDNCGNSRRPLLFKNSKAVEKDAFESEE
jgi:hypothetical protein